MLRFAGFAGVVLGAGLATATPASHSRRTPQHTAAPDTGLMAKQTPLGGAISVDADGAAVTASMIDAGRKIFHGQGGCYACHGTDMQGSAVAPPLHKKGKPWLAAKDGAYQAIVGVITHGVPGTLMISHPNGISDALVADVAAYIWAVNHSGAKP